MRSLVLRHIEFLLLTASAFLLIVAVYFTPHIWRHDEAREALVVQDIFANHHWLLPVRNYELPSKPVLYHWISAALATVLGISDFTVRSPSVIAAVVMVWLTYRLGRFTGERKLACLAVLVLGTTYEFWDSGTEARVDMLFAALVGGALTSWYLWYRTGAERARATVYLAIALAILTKGPAGAALPILVIGSFVLLERNATRLLEFISWRWLSSAAALVVGWYFAAYYLAGHDFFYKQIVFENIDRFFGSGDFHTRKHLFSQAPWFVTQLFPWSLVLLLTLWRRLCGQPVDRFGRFLHCWWLAIFGFFLLGRGQRAVYLLPMYPAVAVLASAEGMRRLMELLPRAAAFLCQPLDLAFGCNLAGRD
jgi:4-amino-4-deoxy-L-arabinose transferase-like glycosyltransferase